VNQRGQRAADSALPRAQRPLYWRGLGGLSTPVSTSHPEIRGQVFTHDRLELLKAPALEAEYRQARPKRFWFGIFTQFGRWYTTLASSSRAWSPGSSPGCSVKGEGYAATAPRMPAPTPDARCVRAHGTQAGHPQPYQGLSSGSTRKPSISLLNPLNRSTTAINSRTASSSSPSFCTAEVCTRSQ
jgi:hypothetical protein